MSSYKETKNVPKYNLNTSFLFFHRIGSLHCSKCLHFSWNRNPQKSCYCSSIRGTYDSWKWERWNIVISDVGNTIQKWFCLWQDKQWWWWVLCWAEVVYPHKWHWAATGMSSRSNLQHFVTNVAVMMRRRRMCLACQIKMKSGDT